MKQNFLKVSKGSIVDAKGRRVILRGVNVGGWLMMEGYIMQAPNVAVRQFKKKFAVTLGVSTLKDFEKSFYTTFIQEKDFQNIAKLGFNCVRLPFHHGLIETKPNHYDREGLSYIERALSWAKKHKLYVILDLHAAAGCQNHDWHSDSLGKAELWKNKTYQRRTFALWKFLANRYKNDPAVAGYDILNESVVDDARVLNQFYKEAIRTIRSVDKNHILFVEGNKWATNIECLADFDDDNWALSIHFYHLIEFTFNLVPSLSYPFRYKETTWDASMVRRMVEVYAKEARRRQLPVLVGEFGVHARDNRFGESAWLADALSSFKKNGFHWTYWTYKAIKHTMFPDGIISYYPNDPWVNRQGPVSGWDTYACFWRKRKKEIMASWKSENYTVNTKIIKVLKNG